MCMPCLMLPKSAGVRSGEAVCVVLCLMLQKNKTKTKTGVKSGETSCIMSCLMLQRNDRRKVRRSIIHDAMFDVAKKYWNKARRNIMYNVLFDVAEKILE